MMEMNQIISNDEQIVEDKRNTFTKMVFTATRDSENKLDMYNPLIWQGFPLSERFWFSFCCKTSLCSDLTNGQFFVDELCNNPCQIDNKLDLKNKCISLSVLKTGTLEIEPAIIHPFVKISIINIKTLKYLQKANFEVPSTLLHEKNMIISHNKTQNTLEYRESNLDFIPPMSTPPFDLRIKGESFAEWNEEFIINDEASNILQSENVIFFELMDFNFFSQRGRGGNSANNTDEDFENEKNPTPEENAKLKSNCIFPIAWGYLKPVGYSQTYLGRFKVQLYKYKYERTGEMEVAKKCNSNYLRTPEVLYEFNWIRKEKYQTFLEIELKTEHKPSFEEMSNLFLQKKFRNSVFRQEGDGDNFDKEIMKLKLEKEKKLKYEEMDHMANAKRKILLKRRKMPSEECKLPDTLLFKFSTARLGCLTHEFSPDGKYLAAACTDITSLTTIKIFNVEDGVIKYHFKGHLQLIHNLTWSFDSKLLISSSSDNYVSFWQIPQEESNNIENTDYMDNDRMFKLTTINHPSYVYSTAIFPDTSKDLLVFASACFDGVIRVFAVDLAYNEAETKYTFIRSNVLKELSVNSEEFAKIDFSQSKKNFFTNMSATGLGKIKAKDSEKMALLGRTVLDHRHPNCLVFDQIGRLYCGDSLGSIHIFEISLNNKIFISKLRTITHKELEGDNINKLTIEPGEKKRLIVHSRDNCIRLIDISKENPRVIIRYFGLKCNKTNIKSSVSPDGQYILSGSEEGKPYLWSLFSGIQIPTEKYECQFLDPIAACSWNSQYNMFAFSGFGQEYPLLVYVHERNVNEMLIDPLELKIKNEQQTLKNGKVEVNSDFNNGVNFDNSKGVNQLTPMQDNISDFTKELKTLQFNTNTNNNFN